MLYESTAHEDACDAARDRWEKLSGEEIAEVIDHLGDGPEAIGIMLHLARRDYSSDAWQVLHSLTTLARADTAQDLREYVTHNLPHHLPVLDKYAKLAAEELKIHEAWIEGEADAELNYSSSPNPDRAFDEARDDADGRI